MAHKPSSDTFHDPENDVPTCNLMRSKYNKGYIAIKIHSMENDPEKEKVLIS